MEYCSSISPEVILTSSTALPSLCLKTEAIFSCAQEIENYFHLCASCGQTCVQVSSVEPWTLMHREQADTLNY